MPVIRAVSPSDLPQLRILTGQRISRVRLVVNRLPCKTVRMFVAERDGQCVGLIRVRVVQRGRRPTDDWWKKVSAWQRNSARPAPDALIQLFHFGQIEQLIVAPAWRRQGIGTALVHSATGWLQEAAPELQVAFGAESVVAEAFWQQLGFQSRQLLFCKRLDAAGQPLRAAIRPATQEDLPQLTEMVCQEIQYQQTVAHCFHLHPNADWLAYVTACLCDPNTQILVAAQDHQLVGYLDAHCVQPWQHKLCTRWSWLVHMGACASGKQPFGVIEDVYVRPELRQQGIATALMHHSFAWFQHQQVFDIQAAVWIGNTPSLYFFHHLGFACHTRIMSKRI